MARWTERQKRFVKLYPIYLNGTRAAIDAGYSPKSAKSVAHSLLHDPQYKHVQEAIEAEMERINARLEVTQERIRREQARIAFASIASFLEWDGEKVRLKPMDQIDPHELGAIAKIRQTKHGIEFELFPKQPALDALARMEGMYKDSLNLKGDGLLLRVAGIPESELAELDQEEDGA